MAASRHWKSSKTHPPRKGWYQIRSVEDGTTDWRAWWGPNWWMQRSDGWIGLLTWEGVYQWREPRKDIKLNYAEVAR